MFWALFANTTTRLFSAPSPVPRPLSVIQQLLLKIKSGCCLETLSLSVFSVCLHVCVFQWHSFNPLFPYNTSVTDILFIFTLESHEVMTKQICETSKFDILKHTHTHWCILLTIVASAYWSLHRWLGQMLSFTQVCLKEIMNLRRLD